MNPLLSPNLTNALADSVIDAAKAAGVPIPHQISRLHSQGSPHHPNLWHLAQGACPREGVIPASTRQRALDDLTALTQWAVTARDSQPVQAMLTAARQDQRRRSGTDHAAMDQAVAIDDALKDHVLTQVFEEPKIARAAIKAHLAETKDPMMVVRQLERTPDVYGEVLGTRRFGVNSGNRHTALMAIRTLMAKPIRDALGVPDQAAPTRPMAVRRPESTDQVQGHVLAFDATVTKLAATHAALLRTDVQRDIKDQKPGAYSHGPVPRARRRKGRIKRWQNPARNNPWTIPHSSAAIRPSVRPGARTI